MRGGSYIESERLRMVRASISIVDADLAGSEPLAEALGVEVPDNWPPELYDRQVLEFSRLQLQDRAERGWSGWYIVNRDSSELMGMCGFKGRPDSRGSVEISYSVLSQFRGCGVASEAVERMVEWAFTHPAVMEVCAETMPHLVQSIGVLENIGFKRDGQGSELGVIRFALRRSELES